MSDKLTENEISLLRLIVRIRDAVGDPHGKLMQDDLVERCKSLKEDKDRLDWVEKRQLDGLVIDHAIHWDRRAIRDYIDAEMDED